MAELSELQKWFISLEMLVLYVLIASPLTYQVTNSIGLPSLNAKGCPSWWGVILHGVVFAVLVRLLMLIPVPE